MRVAIILPSKGRAQQLRHCVNNLLMEIPPAGVEITVQLAVENTDRETVAVAKALVNLWHESEAHVQMVYRDSPTTCVEGFNLGYKVMKGCADWYVLGSDDQMYRPGWLAEALRIAKSFDAWVVGFNDGHTYIEEYAPHYMMSAAFIEQYLGGYMVPPVYKSWWFDREVCEIARRANVYAPAWLAVVDHNHPDWGTAAMDDTYREAWPEHDKDRAIYFARREAGYPMEWAVSYAS